jgi:type IV secretory pathway TraG/TraD family ATPase VirD4
LKLDAACTGSSQAGLRYLSCWCSIVSSVPPALIFCWWFVFHAYASSVFTEGAIIAASGGFIAIVAAMLMFIIRVRKSRRGGHLRLGSMGGE